MKIGEVAWPKEGENDDGICTGLYDQKNSCQLLGELNRGYGEEHLHSSSRHISLSTRVLLVRLSVAVRPARECFAQTFAYVVFCKASYFTNNLAINVMIKTKCMYMTHIDKIL